MSCRGRTQRAPRLTPAAAPATLTKRVLLILVGVGILGIPASSADAARLQVFEAAPFSAAGAFGRPTGVAVNQATGNVYVADSEANEVDVFGTEGGPPASGAPAHITGLAFSSSEPEAVAVDNSCFAHHLTGSACEAFDPANGDVYIAESRGAGVAKFALNAGQYAQVAKLVPPGNAEPNGVAVDTEGNVYVANYHAQAISEFNPAGSEVGAIPQTTIANPAYIAVGAPGVVYIGNYSGTVAKIEVGSGDTVLSQATLDPAGKAVALDAAGDVFVDDESHIDEYSPAGSLTEEFAEGPLQESLGVALNGEDIYASNGGSAKDLLAFGPPVMLGPPPTATTTAATAETGTTATLNGTVNPEGAPTKYWFEYGTTESYGTETAHEPAGEGTTATAVHAPIAQLEPDTEYHFRTRAANTLGQKATGADETFTTTGTPPAINDEATSDVTSHTATLTATINPENQQTSYHFEYATNAALTGASTTSETTVPAAYEEERAGPAELTGLTAATTYYYRLVATNGTTNGNGTREGPIESFITAPLPPTVLTGEATGVTAFSAQVAGVLDGMGAETHYFFNYGLTTSYGSSVPENAPSNADSAGVVSTATPEAVELTGLTPNTNYHFQLVVFNAASCSRFLPGFPINCQPPEDIAYGQDGEFTTLPLAPGATTDPAATVTATDAQLTGRVVPQGATTSYRFEYGTSISYGQNAPASAGAVVGPAVEAEEVTASLDALQPNTTYHFRLVATNPGGTTPGADETFTTDTVGEPGSSSAPAGYALTGTSPAGSPPATFPSLGALSPIPPATAPPVSPASSGSRVLAQALKVCRKDRNGKRRHACEKAVRKKYAVNKEKRVK